SAVYALSLHDALPIWSFTSACLTWSKSAAPIRPSPKEFTLAMARSTWRCCDLKQSKLRTVRTDWGRCLACTTLGIGSTTSRKPRSEEHTSELQSRFDL